MLPELLLLRLRWAGQGVSRVGRQPLQSITPRSRVAAAAPAAPARAPARPTRAPRPPQPQPPNTHHPTLTPTTPCARPLPPPPAPKPRKLDQRRKKTSERLPLLQCPPKITSRPASAPSLLHTVVPVCPARASGSPLFSDTCGCTHVRESMSSMCTSDKKHVPYPPNTTIRRPRMLAECWYRGDGAGPVVTAPTQVPYATSSFNSVGAEG